MNPLQTMLESCSTDCSGRLQLWERVLGRLRPSTILEAGVWKGEFAAHLLATCDSVTVYYMIDPWRSLINWNKPTNVGQAAFDAARREAMAAVAFAHDKVMVFDGTTAEMTNRIADETIDFAYLDGDHTLRGIAIDLLSLWPKVKPGGFVAGDDLSESIWQHHSRYEPTFVFPFVLYFAEAMKATIYALPHRQYLMQKPVTADCHYEFVDLVGRYGDTSLRRQMRHSISGVLRDLVRGLLGPVVRAFR